MKIFMSWSGKRSEELAKALREWFPLVLHFVDPWLSQSDIQPGERWTNEIAKNLETCNFGIICITRENLNSIWILFEAGALAKSMESSRVILLLFDLDFKEISGPLSQFQAKKSDSVGIKELVFSLNKVAPTPVPDAQLEKLFSALWPDLEKKIISIPQSSTTTKQNRNQGEILEELVSSVRIVEMRLRDATDESLSMRTRQKIRFHPEMLHLIHRISDGPRDPIQLLIIASLFRDSAPWLYELALDSYRAVKTGLKSEAQKALKRFIDVLDLVQRGPFSEEVGIDRMSLKFIQRLNIIEMIAFFDFEDSSDTVDTKLDHERKHLPKDRL